MQKAKPSLCMFHKRREVSLNFELHFQSSFPVTKQILNLTVLIFRVMEIIRISFLVTRNKEPAIKY